MLHHGMYLSKKKRQDQPPWNHIDSSVRAGNGEFPGSHLTPGHCYEVGLVLAFRLGPVIFLPFSPNSFEFSLLQL